MDMDCPSSRLGSDILPKRQSCWSTGIRGSEVQMRLYRGSHPLGLMGALKKLPKPSASRGAEHRHGKSHLETEEQCDRSPELTPEASGDPRGLGPMRRCRSPRDLGTMGKPYLQLCLLLCQFFGFLLQRQESKREKKQDTPGYTKPKHH